MSTTNTKNKRETNLETLMALATKNIRRLEQANRSMDKKKIHNAIEVGKELQVIYDKAEHGQYMDWLKRDFPDMSHGTTLNYRGVYNLSQNRKACDFDKLNIPLTALYYVAKFIEDNEPAGDAILEAAQQRYVSFQDARRIETVQKYTALIKNRQLYEGACSLAWLAYFEYRNAYPDECIPLTNDDLAYGVQWWGSAGPALAIETETTQPVEGAPAIEAAPVIKAALAIEAAPAIKADDDETRVRKIQAASLARDVIKLDILEDDHRWPDTTALIGLDTLHRIAAMLQVVCDQHSEDKKKSTVQQQADRAEQKPKALVH